MKIERVSEHIWSLKSWILIPIRVWVVAGEDGVTLVDAGLSVMSGGILRFIDSLNAGPLKRILLTHGHGDHVGAVSRILSDRQVPVYAHGIEIPFAEGKLPYPRRKKPEAGVASGVLRPLAHSQDGRLELVAGLRPYLTPGHSPGHVIYYHEQDRVMLAGDLFTSKNGKLRKPMAMFTADMDEAVRSSAVLTQVDPLRLEVCHGGPVLRPAQQLANYLRTAGKGALPW